jgi:transposase
LAAGRARSLQDGGDPQARSGRRQGPSREREVLVGERTRIINRLKSALARLGIRHFKPNLRKAAERLGGPRAPEGGGDMTTGVNENFCDPSVSQRVCR